MSSNEKNTEAFLALLMSNQRKIHSYILSLVPSFSDADDITQETISTMWKKFDQFETGTDFASWGARIAYFHIMNYRKKKSRDMLSFNNDVFNQVNEIAKEKHHEADDRIDMLRDCIRRLKQDDRSLIKARYELSYTVKSLAAQLSRSTPYIYRHLSRIHYQLNLCVKQRMRERQGMI